MKSGALLCCALAAAALCCTSSRVPPMEESVLRALRDRGGGTHWVLPFALSPEMRSWVHEKVPEGIDPGTRLEALLHALLAEGGVAIAYDRAFTGTAEEVFAERRANCLAFTHLFVGMARELGLAVYYLRVHDIDRFSKEGDLIVASGHITAGFGPPNRRRILDFTEQPVGEYRDIEQVMDTTAVALFYSNRGAEYLRQAKAEEALGWLEPATRIDPELATAWVNYGVALRRNGKLAPAEAAYRRALEADPRESGAYQNLAALLDLRGQTEEAAGLLALAAQARNRNPFSYLALGDLALRQHHLADAERFYRRAAQLGPKEAEVQAALGELALANGAPRQAKKLLRRATEIDPGNPRVQRLARSLAAI